MGERKTAIRLVRNGPLGADEITDRPIVPFAFVDESDRDKPHGGSLRFLDLVRYRENLPLTNDAYAIDLNGADGVRLVYVTISKENKVAVGNFRGDSLHPLAQASDFDPVLDFYYDFGAIAGAQPDGGDPFHTFTHAGILLDRVAPSGHPTEAAGRGQTFGWGRNHGPKGVGSR